MKFRILQEGNKYYPQVKETNIFKRLSNPLWWLSWKRISKHPEGEFGLYEELKYGLDSKQECLDFIEEYKKYLLKKGKFIIHKIN